MLGHGADDFGSGLVFLVGAHTHRWVPHRQEVAQLCVEIPQLPCTSSEVQLSLQPTLW